MSSRCGYVAIIGRPNVGKSTLLNRLLGQKLSITSHKPQTTRHRILGIKTIGDTQTVYIDTPGIHKNVKHAINRYMNRTATAAINDVDVIGFMVEALKWTDEDEWVLSKLKKATCPTIAIVNKADQFKDKTELLPYLAELQNKLAFTAIIPLSAKTGSNLKSLEKTISELLPENPHYFSDDQITDRSERFVASEFIREKIFRTLQQELPYISTVEIESFQTKQKILHIHAVIWVEKDNQKAIVIGKNGEQLKNIGSRARLELEKFFQQKVFLKLWVKVKDSWSDNERALKSLGYTE
jgi:GTPase